MSERDKRCETCLYFDEGKCHLDPLAGPKQAEDWCGKGWEESSGWYATGFTVIFGIWQMIPFRPWFLREEEARAWTEQWDWPDYVTAVWPFGAECPSSSELVAAKREELGIETPKRRGILERVFG